MVAIAQNNALIRNILGLVPAAVRQHHLPDGNIAFNTLMFYALHERTRSQVGRLKRTRGIGPALLRLLGSGAGTRASPAAISHASHKLTLTPPVERQEVMVHTHLCMRAELGVSHMPQQTFSAMHMQSYVCTCALPPLCCVI